MIALVVSLVVSTHAYDASWVDCYDGDTCRFNIHLGLNATLTSQTIRFCDINAPEMRGDDKVAGAKARDALRERLAQSTKVRLFVAQKANCNRSEVLDCDKHDSFGRWLAYVIADGVNLNHWLLEQKLVGEYPKKCEEWRDK